MALRPKFSIPFLIPKRTFSQKMVRVRFAPSPTGFVHLGGLRTALFNFLYAKKHCGKFLLRIEDTDQSRIVPGSLEGIIDTLRWANLEPDEGPGIGGSHGPYIQSQRIDLYREMIERLLKTDSVYRCFCTSKRLELLRREAAKNRETIKYDNRCRSLSPEEIRANLSSDKPFTVRLKLKPGPTQITDMIYGSTSFDLSQIEGDPIIYKSDGLPTYHFANVVDDHLMEISHVLRGVEWLVSTPKHLMLYEAFGWPAPQYAHLPLLVNKDGSKLSKRHDHIRISSFQEEGFYPETIVNYLTQLGGGFGQLHTADCDRIYPLEKLTESFFLEAVNQNNCRIDYDKIRRLNRIYIQNLVQNNPDQIFNELTDLLKQNQSKLLNSVNLEDREYVQKILTWCINRIHTLKELISPDFLFLWAQPKLDWNVDAFPSAEIVLTATIETLKTINPLDFNDKDQLLDRLRELHNTQLKDAIQFSSFMKLLRLALTNLKVGPPVAEAMSLLGRDRTIQYITNAYDYVKNR